MVYSICCSSVLCLSSLLKKHIFLLPIKVYCVLHLTCVNSINLKFTHTKQRAQRASFYCCSKFTNFLHITQMSMQTQIKMGKLSWLISDFFVYQLFQSFNFFFGRVIVVINRLPKRWLNMSH